MAFWVTEQRNQLTDFFEAAEQFTGFVLRDATSPADLVSLAKRFQAEAPEKRRLLRKPGQYTALRRWLQPVISAAIKSTVEAMPGNYRRPNARARA